METKNELHDLLQKLEKESGILFEVSSSSLDDETTIQKVRELLNSYQTNDSKVSFLSRFLPGSLSIDEITKGMHRFHIEESVLRVLFLLEFKQPYDSSVISILSSLFFPGANELVEMDATHIVLIRQLKSKSNDEELLRLALNIVDTLNTEAMLSVKVSYDCISDNFHSLTNCYQNTVTAIKIGHIFHSADRVFPYRDLGLGKLIYHLPKDACQDYLDENLNHVDLYDLDEETLHTIQTFFDSGLSIAETARQLYIHRNTLVYRLEKIEKTTGLDIRNFDDAVICKIAMLLSDYLHSQPEA